MTRYVSFGVLLCVILVLCIVFYKVMASFMLPLFLATILVVVFRPVHSWVREKCSNRNAIAAAVTTSIISLSVIVPVGLLGLFAFGEARELFKSLSSGGIEQNIVRVRKSLNLEIPSVTELHELELEVRALDTRNLRDLESSQSKLTNISVAAEKFQDAIKISKTDDELFGNGRSFQVTKAQVAMWEEFRESIPQALVLREKFVELLVLRIEASEAQKSASPQSGKEVNASSDSPTKGDASASDNIPEKSEEKPEPVQDFDSEFKSMQSEYRKSLIGVGQLFEKFKVQLLGGQLNVYLKELANPTDEEFSKYNESVTNWIKVNLLSLSGKTTQALFMVLFNGAIMMVAVYFFLLDGSKMIDAFKFLSPLDDRHEQELIDEFDKVSRAVVVATLAAALAQGVLAGIGYYFAGVNAVFLLTMLTAVLALVPFVGAGSVWLPACLYLYLVEDQWVPAVGLAIWGAAVVSTIDNLIKPYVLHGQSNIHPLFALLSVLGGVTALGPIGILVGPMVVVFLQTLLKILQRELLDLDANHQSSESDVADENASALDKESDTEPDPELEIDSDIESKAQPSDDRGSTK